MAEPMDTGLPNSSVNMPWVEKYRPASLDELVSHEDIITTIKRFIAASRIPHMLLYGPPGTGKTSTILALAKTIYTENEFRSMILELNASDDRGINVVRDDIIPFAQSKGLHSFSADPNRKKKVKELIIPRLDYVIDAEKVNITEDGRQALLKLSEGDMRRSTVMAFPEVNEDSVYKCIGQPTPKHVAQIMQVLLNDRIHIGYTKLQKECANMGFALADIITHLHGLVVKLDLPGQIVAILVEALCDAEKRLAEGGAEKQQLAGVCASFVQARRLIELHAATK